MDEDEEDDEPTPSLTLPRVAPPRSFGEFMEATQVLRDMVKNMDASGSTPFNIPGGGIRNVQIRADDQAYHHQLDGLFGRVLAELGFFRVLHAQVWLRMVGTWTMPLCSLGRSLWIGDSESAKP